MRLIDADALIKRMNEDCLTCIDYYEKPDACMKCKFTKVEKAINETPTVSQAERMTMNNDLISKSHFDKRVREAVGMTISELTADFKDGVRTTLELLKTEPTVDANHIADDGKKVDAVEVVRCEDCRKQLICYHSDNYFCADGERKDDESEN